MQKKLIYKNCFVVIFRRFIYISETILKLQPLLNILGVKKTF